MQLYYKLAHMIFVALQVILQWYLYLRLHSTAKVQDLSTNRVQPLHNLIQTKTQIMSPKKVHGQSRQSVMSVEESQQLHDFFVIGRKSPKRKTTQLQVVKEKVEEESQVNKLVKQGSTKQNFKLKEFNQLMKDRRIKRNHTMLVVSSNNSQFTLDNKIKAPQQSFVQGNESSRMNTQQNELTLVPIQKKQSYDSRIVFQLINRIMIVQGFMGWMLYAQLDYLIAALLSIIISFIMRGLQFNNKTAQFIELWLCKVFVFVTLGVLEIDLTWSVTYLVLILLEILASILIQMLAKKVRIV